MHYLALAGSLVLSCAASAVWSAEPTTGNPEALPDYLDANPDLHNRLQVSPGQLRDYQTMQCRPGQIPCLWIGDARECWEDPQCWSGNTWQTECAAPGQTLDTFRTSDADCQGLITWVAQYVRGYFDLPRDTQFCMMLLTTWFWNIDLACVSE